MRRLRWPVVVWAGLAWGLIAPAGAAPKAAEPLLGRYAFEVDRKGASGCIVTLHGEGRAGEYRLDLNDACRDAFPFLQDIRAWLPRGDGFAFVYRVGGTAMAFSSLGNDEYSGSLRKGAEGTNDYFVMGRYAETPEDFQRQRDGLAATWLLWARAEDNAPNCRIRLVARPQPAVECAPECAAIVPGAARIVSWTIERPWRIAFTDRGGAAILSFGWLTYGTYGAPDNGPALTRVY